MYESLIKPFLFSLSPEKAHKLALNSLETGLKLPLVASSIKNSYQFHHESLETELFGLKFPNPVGLAAGFDKEAKHIDALAELGFGFVEIGTITPKAQAGNPQPRLFRLPKDQALINRMGFNNDGMEVAVERLKSRKSNIIVGGNIGKNKVTPNNEASNDYLLCFNALYDYVDYFVVNVSSPNTPGLRELQEKAPLTKLLNTLQSENHKKNKAKPILLKIAPDLNEGQLEDIIEIVQDTNLSGIVASNTTIDRSGLQTDSAEIEKIGNGGLSGYPVKKRSTEVIKFIRNADNSVPIIGVGGIMNGKDAKEKLEAGANLVQIYTGFVYGGPGIVKDIKQYISNGN